MRAAPWLISLANAAIQGRLEERQVGLARDAVDNLQQLGPTFVKCATTACLMRMCCSCTLRLSSP